METIDILTGQHVTIKYEPAGILRRGCALIIDFIILFLYIYIIFYFLQKIDMNIFLNIKNVTSFIVLFPAICYHFFFETLMNGKTPGKLITGTRVTNLDGSTPGLSSYFLRWILLPIDLFPSGIGLGGLFIVFSKNHQRIGDLAAETIVVRNVRPPQVDLDRDFREFSDDYRPTFSQVEQLNDAQIRFISALLYDSQNRKALSSSIQSLSRKVKNTLKVESQLDDRSFLETIVRDYNYYTWHSLR
ncbi:MAG: RDD family protein [Dysgonamonadaceae bacterium]|jgi:uncharacterized RDD family membrane protein YckC|nr:RDD family protein [Dysgonamonadaceae bacterium]